MFPACRPDHAGCTMPPCAVVPSDVAGFMEALWECQSALHDGVACRAPRAHGFEDRVGPCRARERQSIEPMAPGGGEQGPLSGWHHSPSLPLHLRQHRWALALREAETIRQPLGCRHDATAQAVGGRAVLVGRPRRMLPASPLATHRAPLPRHALPRPLRARLIGEISRRGKVHALLFEASPAVRVRHQCHRHLYRWLGNLHGQWNCTSVEWAEPGCRPGRCGFARRVPLENGTAGRFVPLRYALSSVFPLSLSVARSLSFHSPSPIMVVRDRPCHFCYASGDARVMSPKGSVWSRS
jgi:hypothetical protein